MCSLNAFFTCNDIIIRLMKNYPEWAQLQILIDLRNRFATCYQNDDGSVFYIEPQFYECLQGYKRLKPDEYPLIIAKMDEIVRKNGKVVFVGQEDNPLVDCEDAIFLTAVDVADMAHVVIDDNSRGSDYGD